MTQDPKTKEKESKPTSDQEDASALKKAAKTISSLISKLNEYCNRYGAPVDLVKKIATQLLTVKIKTSYSFNEYKDETDEGILSMLPGINVNYDITIDALRIIEDVAKDNGTNSNLSITDIVFSSSGFLEEQNVYSLVGFGVSFAIKAAIKSKLKVAVGLDGPEGFAINLVAGYAIGQALDAVNASEYAAMVAKGIVETDKGFSFSNKISKNLTKPAKKTSKNQKNYAESLLNTVQETYETVDTSINFASALIGTVL